MLIIKRENYTCKNYNVISQFFALVLDSSLLGNGVRMPLLWGDVWRVGPCSWYLSVFIQT